ncbi:MAG: FtsX-like permease family protein [Eubacteriales bacterium]
MNKLSFYGKLAATNLKKNREGYRPYLLTAIGCTAMLYIMFFLCFNERLARMKGGRELGPLLGFGSAVVVIFTAILLFYTNRFLTKRRKKEFGLYNILGMEKKHLGIVMLFETLYSFLMIAVGGIFFGVLLSKLAMLVLLKLAGLGTGFSFELSLPAAAVAVICIGAIHILSLTFNLLSVGLSRPIELLHGESTGEREPKTKWVLTLLGLISLGIGYYLALSTEDPLEALEVFFIAVLLVIAGTYLLFTAGSVALLKLLRKNKRYYYKTGHFISVSSMLHRMKANAVGLGNICILSTMVLITLSTTVCLYLGLNQMIEAHYPSDLIFRISGTPNEEGKDRIRDAAEGAIADSGCRIEKTYEYSFFAFTSHYQNGELSVEKAAGFDYKDLRTLIVMTLDDYNRVVGADLSLEDDRILLYNCVGKLSDDFPDGSFTLMGESYRVEKEVDPIPVVSLFYSYTQPVYLFVVKDQATFDRIWKGQAEIYEDAASEVYLYLGYDLDGTPDQQSDASDRMEQNINLLLKEDWSNLLYPGLSDEELRGYSYGFNCRAAEEAYYKSMYGGFLFLGILLGGLFLMANVMMIYYKQIAEGYEDRKRYAIMKKVGLTAGEIRRAIFSQTVLFFFLPLATAALHVAVAFPIVEKLLWLFGLSNTALFLACTLGTLLIFTLVYVAVYLITARSYSRIVGSDEAG